MTTFPFESFIELVRFDQEIKKNNRAIDKEQKGLLQLQENKVQFEQEMLQLKQVVHDAQKTVDATELDMKSLDERESDIKNKIDNLENPKEYAGLKKELDAIHGAQNELEDELVSAWNRLETAQRTLSQKSGEIETKIQEAHDTLVKKEQEIAQLKQTVEESLQHRSDKLTPIPEEWLEKYEMMYKRVDDPVVEVLQDGCGGCFYPVPNQDLARLKRKALLQCSSCYRFLYDPAMLTSANESVADKPVADKSV